MASNQVAQRTDPAPSFKFCLEIEGIIVGQFKECSGLSVEREVKTYREGGVNDHVHFLPGSTTFSRITLKRGITDSHDLWNWYQHGLHDGKVKRVNMSILLLNTQGETVKHWDVQKAYPVKWVGPNLDSSTGQVAIETLELVHEGLVLK